ncbi:MAG: cyclic nucleotide-binding domain-containing protein [Opitutae bacterium]|nr:cyclic nucleotide-binding domain-containing protein [Opitutae bacterium]
MDILSHRFLSHFPAARGAELARAARSIRFPDQAVIFEEGAPSDAIYLILTGRVRLTKRGAGGAHQTIARLGPDNYFGELGVLDGSGRSTRALAEGPVQLARIPHKPFVKALSQSPWHTVLRLFNHISENLRTTNDRYVTEVTRKEKITLIGEMANGMIHDFKSPFTTIRLAVESLAIEHHDRRTQELCHTVSRQIRRLAGMVEEVLEFARGETHLTKRTVRLQALFEHVTETSADSLRQTKTKVAARPTALLATVDFDRLARVLLNLVTNAAEAIGPAHRGRITLAATRRHGQCEITVTDNGPGIPRLIRDTLFEPFVTHGKRGGTGLGLAIAKSVVDAHGGSLAFRSSSRGTTFAIRLPAAG